MKTLLTILGPNGVGKSTVAQKIMELRENIALVDSDWCRVIKPFVFTESTKQTVIENIYCLLRNYLYCRDIDTVLFTYGWHGERKEIYEKIIEKLKRDNIDFQNRVIILKCSKEENIRRAKNDGRDDERVKRGMEKTFSFYDRFDFPCIDTTNMLPEEVAKKICSLLS